MRVNPELKDYIEKHVLPQYEKNEIGHGPDHIRYVIKRSFRLAEENNLDVNPDMVYVIAAYHDIGHIIDPKHHEIISAEIMSKDQNLKRFFNKNELAIIKEAIEDHRAKADTEPRSIYGKIVSSADRTTSVNVCLKRTYTYGMKLLLGATDEELYENAYDALVKKYGEEGYAKFYFKDSLYDKFVKDLRELLRDKENFIHTQREYIEGLKERHEL